MLLPPAGFTSTKKIIQMSYHMCPARRKNTPSPEMGNTAAPFPFFLFFFLKISLQLPHNGRQKQGPTQTFMQQNSNERAAGSNCENEAQFVFTSDLSRMAGIPLIHFAQDRAS